jgi:cystathionine beta-lyase
MSDEIHCDLTEPGYGYIPFASVSETCAQNSITCIAPTKAFNLAGLQTAAVMVPNEELRHKMERALNTDEVAEPNSFAICATKAAFNQSEDWLNELNQYIQKNKDYAISFIQKEMNDVYVVPTEATYLLWIDCHKVCMDTSFIREKTGLYVSDGLEYGENGKAFIRMNVACPFERLKDGLNRFKEGIYLYQNK